MYLCEQLMPWRWRWFGFVVRLTHVMKELIAYETWHGVMWSRWRRSRQDLAWRKSEGKLSDDLAPMDRGNGEEQVKSRSMNQYGQWWYEVDHIIWWLVGACVASTMEEMEWNAQGKGIFVGHFISPIKACVEKCMTRFMIDGQTIKRSKLVCISVI